MGLDDRDYMRDRARQRAGHFRKPIDMEFNYTTGRWEEPKPKRASRRPTSKARTRGFRFLTPWTMSIAAVALLLSYYYIKTARELAGHANRAFYEQPQPFPQSGEFKVRGAQARQATAHFAITAGDRNAVVELVRPDGTTVFMTFVRMNEMAGVLVPQGTWTLRLAVGETWYGEKYMFGYSGAFADSRRPIIIGPGEGRILDLRHVFNGNLETDPDWRVPQLEFRSHD